MQENTVLTTQEVADMLKIAKNTVYELIKRGELNSYRVGKKVRIDLQDVWDYKKRTMTRKTNEVQASGLTWPDGVVKDHYYAENENYYKMDKNQDSFVICGQDILLDVLSRKLQFHPNGVSALRSYVGSYNALYALYHGNVQIATTHLWDGETDQYNVPYVKRLLPGVPAVIIRLATRMQGFYVAKGNPKNITGWEDLRRQDISIINREKGSGTRVLLDENLKLMGLASNSIQGYHRESTSHLAIASTVARGGADIGVGNEKSALQVNGIDFIPLQKEHLDMVIKKEDLNGAPYQAVIDILNSKEFRMELEGIGGYQLTELGKIVAET